MQLKTASLPPVIKEIVCHAKTERPFTGEYDNFDAPGTYLCRQCGIALFRAERKFHSGCGWPSFDAAIDGCVTARPDPDGQRSEIVCTRCQAHLGHVFHGEGFTAKNTRHCVNSLSLDYVSNLQVNDTEEGIFAGGCFWGIEYYFKKLPGVLKVEVGYTGGVLIEPNYEAVCMGTSGHLEAIRVVYDPTVVDYEAVAKYFFEIHDPTQVDGQGPDKGPQYLSAVFYYDDMQKHLTNHLIHQLMQKGYPVITQVLPVSPFWRAETYHQDYYSKTGKTPYCHHYEKRF